MDNIRNQIATFYPDGSGRWLCGFGFDFVNPVYITRCVKDAQRWSAEHNRTLADISE